MLLCKLFGHRPAFGYGHSEGQGYFQIIENARDGIGRQHAGLFCDCERCGENYKVGNIHIPQKYVDAITEKKRFITD